MVRVVFFRVCRVIYLSSPQAAQQPLSNIHCKKRHSSKQILTLVHLSIHFLILCSTTTSTVGGLWTGSGPRSGSGGFEGRGW